MTLKFDHYAVTLGMREIYGVGRTENEALEDVRRQFGLSIRGAQIVRCTAEVYADVYARGFRGRRAYSYETGGIAMASERV